MGVTASVGVGVAEKLCGFIMQVPFAFLQQAASQNKYKEILKDAGMTVCGLSPDDTIVEAVERPESDFFLGVSFHPEYKSRPDVAHPIFKALIKKVFENKNK